MTPILTMLEATRQALENTPDWNNPIAWRRQTRGCALPGADLPERAGGCNYNARTMVDLFAQCGKHNLDLRDVPGGGHARLVTLVNTRQFDTFLRGVANADYFCAVAITEEDAGSDMHALQTTATPTRGGYFLRGKKSYIARLAQSSHAIVFAHVPRPGAEKRLTAFLVALDTDGLTQTVFDAFGLHGVSFGTLAMVKVFVPSAQRVGGEGQGFQLFTRHFTYWRTAMAAAAIGCARGALDQAMAWLHARHAFGGPIGRFSHLQQELAQHVARVHMAWLLICAVAERIDARQPAFADAAMAKAEAVEIALAAADWAMRTHGARGHTTQYDIAQRYRDLASLRIADGTTDVLRGQVARALLGEELYELSLSRERPSRVQDVLDRDNELPSRRYW
jgi:alkylation response protein AidB-like acyl-CoA dehydrogenase